MKEYILIIILEIANMIYFLYKIKNGHHMLQLESYKNERFFKWIKNNKTIYIKEILLIGFPIISMFRFNLGMISNTIYTLLLFLFRPKFSNKKPLVVTSRIKRMYITELLIAIITIVISILNKYCLFIFPLLIIFSYEFVILINTINSPIEKCVQKKFYKKAKKKLEEMPNLKIIGVTGSYGKTSTKYILGTILSQKYTTLITPGSYNTTMGVVRTINEHLKNTHEVFVCEMGAKNVGDIKEICDLVKPDYGVLTSIGPQHLETFKNIDNVKKTKCELIEAIGENGKAFLNFEDEIIKTVKVGKDTVTYGFNSKYNYYADNININEFGSTFDIHIDTGDIISVKTKLLGIHNILNIVGATAVACELGLTKNEIQAGVRFLKPVEHRLELIQNPNGSIIIDDAYNSNTKGAQMALEVLSNFKNKKKILITPGIVDLGDKQFEYNKILGKQASKACDYVILVGEKQAEPIKEGLLEEKFDSSSIFIAKDLTQAISKMNEIMDGNSVILLENDLPDNYL